MSEIPKKDLLCQNCGNPYFHNWHYCSDCGALLPLPEDAENLPEVDRCQIPEKIANAEPKILMEIFLGFSGHADQREAGGKFCIDCGKRL